MIRLWVLRVKGTGIIIGCYSGEREEVEKIRAEKEMEYKKEIVMV